MWWYIGAIVIGLIVLAAIFSSAADGYQDHTGYHDGKPPER